MKKYLFLLACLLNTVLASAQFSGSGTGTEDDPYLIYNETQLYQMNNFLGSDNAGAVFKLMKDLDLTDFISENFPSEGWLPVGVESSPFEGKFYGNNHTISGLWINRPSIGNVGFFGYASGATIKDINVYVNKIVGVNCVGSVVGLIIGSTAVSNCSAVSSEGVSGTRRIGGIVGKCTSSSISACSYEGSVTATESGSYDATGGVVGYVEDGTVTSCSATSTVTGTKNVGGIVGYDSGGNISSCNVTGSITGTSSNIGGIVGLALKTLTIQNSKHVGNIKGKGNVGGVAGNLEKGSFITFNNSHSKGEITNTSTYTGGVVGVSQGGCIAGMENCSHFGDINGQNYVGGLIGASIKPSNSAETIYISTSNTENTKSASMSTSEFISGTDELLVNNCNAVGNITGSSYVGGLVGLDEKAFACSNWQTGSSKGITYTYSVIDKTNPSDITYYLYYGDNYVDSKTVSYTSSTYDHSYSDYANHYIYYYKYVFTPTWSPNIRISAIAYTNSYYSGVINGSDNIGGIAGYKWCGRIQNCYTNATVYGNKNVGGIIGNAEGYSTSTLTLKSDVAINSTISATEENIGRIYGVKNDFLTIGALASAEGNRALTTTKVIKQGVAQEITDDLQNGNAMGKSLLKLKASYVALGWDFDNNWDILETECFPYKKYQAAPPVIESNPVSQDTEITGLSLNGGTVYMYYKDRDAVSTTCDGNAWKFTTEALQSGATVQLYADVDGMVPSYFTSTTVGYPGSGTEADPYRVYSAEDLQGASNKGYYKLMNDIDLTSWINENSPTEGWVAIGRNSGDVTYIDGDGHKVSGLWINTTTDYTGLFSNYSAGYIKNLTVEVASGKNVKGGDYTGVLIGRMSNGQIVNCTIKGDVEGTTHVGGVAGYTEEATLTSNTYEGSVTTAAVSAYAGGIAGHAVNVTTSESNATATISSTGATSNVGGLFGKSEGGSIVKCFANTTLTATGATDNVGGLVGYSGTPISISYSCGTVTASGDNANTGGLVGYATGSVENCYSTATATGTQYTAGLVAYTTSSINNCYANGDVYGVMYGAGVVGELDGSSASLTNSIAANNRLDLSDESSWGCRVIGGFKNGCTEPTLGSNLALSTMQVSLNGVAQKKTDDNIEGVATSEEDLKKSSTYTALGWDFAKTWSIEEGEGYPLLMFTIKYTVTYKVDGEVYKTDSYAEGAEIIPASEPTKEGYTFSGWSEIPSVMPANDIEVTGTFTEIPVTYDDTDVSQYDNIVYIDKAEGSPSSQVTLSVQMNNTESVYGYEFKLYLPDGITVATETDSYGDTNPCVTLSTTRTSATRHTFESSISSDGVLTVLCYSTKKYAFINNSGEVAQIVLDIASDVEAGDYPIIIKSEAISLDSTTPEIDFIKSTLTVSDFKLGDANGDGKVNVGDITAIAGYILGSAPSNFVEKGADANGDGKVNVGDITTIAGMILNGTANSAKARIPSADAFSSIELAMADVDAVSNEVIVPVCVNNTADAFSSFQFDVNVPEGFTVKNVAANSSRISLDCLSGAVTEGGNYRVLGYNLRNSAVRDTEGAIVYLTLEANDALTNGLHEVSIDNAVFAKGSKTIDVAGATMNVNVADATGILNIASTGKSVNVYDVDGRLVRNGVNAARATEGLANGVYIVNGVKVIK